MLKSFIKQLIHPHSHTMYLGKGGHGQKIRIVKLKSTMYESLIKQGATDMTIIEIKDDYVIVSVPSTSYDKFIHYHKLD